MAIVNKTVVLEVVPTADFSITTRKKVRVVKGQTAEFHVSAKALSGFESNVAVSTTGLPTGVNPGTVITGNMASLYIDTESLEPGVYPFTIVAEDTLATGFTPPPQTAPGEINVVHVLVGPTGPAGSDGEAGRPGDDGQTGPIGGPGESGATGPAGQRGDIGPTGWTGEDGLQGDAGEVGDTGPTGPRGETGPTGPAGEGGGGRYIQLDIHAKADANATWTNMPAAEEFLFGNWRHAHNVDLTDSTQARLVVTKLGTAGAAASKLMLKYRTAFSTTVGNYSNIGVSEVSVAVNTTNNVLVSGWVDLAEGAKGGVIVVVTGSGGDGAIDPLFGNISAQFK